jgi:hypothetical protein
MKKITSDNLGTYLLLRQNWEPSCSQWACNITQFTWWAVQANLTNGEFMARVSSLSVPPRGFHPGGCHAKWLFMFLLFIYQIAGCAFTRRLTIDGIVVIAAM